ALFLRPDHAFVGYFIGSPGMNLCPIELDADGARIGSQRLTLGAATLAALGDAHQQAKSPLTLGIRPEFVRLAHEGE
ncbi:ABC transporter ATP-binding protein, partial [Paraburkholderia sp. SIMBA_054]